MHNSNLTIISEDTRTSGDQRHGDKESTKQGSHTSGDQMSGDNDPSEG